MQRWLAVLVAIGCGAPTTPTTKGRPVTDEPAAPNGARSPAGDAHPGAIVFEDNVQHKTWTERASAVPPSIAWVEVDGVWKPVVKIRIDGMGGRREMTSLGPNGELLEHTTGTLGPR